MLHVPSIYLFTGGSTLFALAGLLIAHKFINPIDLDKNQSSLDAMLSIVGTLVSILLGLLVASSLSNYQALEADVDAEAASVAGICRLSLGLPDNQRRAILKDCLDYCENVANDEWPAMTRGHFSEQTFTAYGNLLKDVVKLKPANNGETNIQSALIANVQLVGDYRRKRILWLGSTWNRNLMPVLLVCTLILLTFTYFYVRRGAMILHGFLVCLVATALGANLGLIALLGSPFKGDWRIQPEGFRLNSKLIRKYSDVH